MELYSTVLSSDGMHFALRIHVDVEFCSKFILVLTVLVSVASASCLYPSPPDPSDNGSCLKTQEPETETKVRDRKGRKAKQECRK